MRSKKALDPEILPSSTDLVPAEPSSDDASSGGLQAFDALKSYLKEVHRHPLLSPEEELKLAIELKNTGSLEAAKRLVTANLRLVVKIAYEYQQVYANLLDLVQEGNVGLMKAVSKFDPAKGVRLSTYAAIWIRSYILKYLLDNFRMVKIGTTQAQKKLFYQLMREKERLEAQGLLAGPKLLAQKLDVREKDVEEMSLRLSREGAEVSLDAPVDPGGEGQARFVDLLDDHRPSADSTLEKEELLGLLKESLPEFRKTLSDKERAILERRVLAEEPQTLQEVADQYGLTRERVRQIEAKLIVKFRQFLSEKTGEPIDEDHN